MWGVEGGVEQGMEAKKQKMCQTFQRIMIHWNKGIHCVCVLGGGGQIGAKDAS